MSFDQVTFPLLCTVRGCGEALHRNSGSLRCPRGHSFDIARSGYVNLLQPQDRKSPQAGDSETAVRARRRLSAKGGEDWMVDELAAVVPAPAGRCPAVLDVGCGEGSHLGALGARLKVEGAGVDLSVPAITLASRSYPGPLWVVANADRGLPFGDGSFDLVMTVTARLPVAEIARTLKESALLLVVVAGRNDLAELRQEIMGRSEERDRGSRVLQETAAAFTLLKRWERETRIVADPDTLRDLTDITYRGGRAARERRLAVSGTLEVTLAREFLLFQKQ